MGAAASEQLEALRAELEHAEPGTDEARGAYAVCTDLELFVAQSAKQRAKVSAPKELGRALGPLKEVATSVERGVKSELEAVTAVAKEAESHLCLAPPRG